MDQESNIPHLSGSRHGSKSTNHSRWLVRQSQVTKTMHSFAVLFSVLFFTFRFQTFQISVTKKVSIAKTTNGVFVSLQNIFELFCLQNSLVVGMQPQVSGKVGSLVGWFLGGPCSAFPTTVEFYRKASCRGRNKNADENARKILLLKRHYESVRISFA